MRPNIEDIVGEGDFEELQEYLICVHGALSFIGERPNQRVPLSVIRWLPRMGILF